MSKHKRSNPRKFVFGNEKFGGSYIPGELEFNFPEDMSREDFEKIFEEKIKSLHKRGSDLKEEFFDNTSKKKEKLKPLSIRVKPHTKEFFKNHSILSARDVLEIYEEFNNSSEAFINSLIEEEKQLENDLAKIQEKLHNAKLFKDKLSEIRPNDISTDEDKISTIKNSFSNSEIKIIGNEISQQKACGEIARDIKIYNTLIIRVYDKQVLSIGVYTGDEPIVYYFKNEYSKDDISEILSNIEKYCQGHEIQFSEVETSLFKDE